MNTILQGSCRDVLKRLASESVHCVVTSPPYWGLRDYGVEGQLGLEKTPEEYLANMRAVFAEVRRVLRSDGTLWLNMGDSYNSGTSSKRKPSVQPSNDHGYWLNAGSMGDEWVNCPGLEPKQLIGMPWRLAFALQADGWWLRQDIIWHKPNPMPESVTDRCTKAHEYLFLLAKRERYFYDAEAVKEQGTGRSAGKNTPDKSANGKGFEIRSGFKDVADVEWFSRNRRSVWTINSEPYNEAHFATFPTALVKPCILAGTSAKGCCPKCGAPWERVVEQGELVGRTPNDGKGYVLDKVKLGGSDKQERVANGWTPNHHRETRTTGWRPTCDCGLAETEPCVVLDPFGGSGTVGEVATELGRRSILIELNPDYVKLAEARTRVTPGLPLS